MFSVLPLDNLNVPYAHLIFGPSTRYQQGSYYLQEITLAIELDDFKLPEESPIVTFEQMLLEIKYSFPESKTSGSQGDLTIFGTATVQLGHFDAICTFDYSRAAEVIEADLAEGEDEGAVAAADTNNATNSDSFQGYLDFQFQFQSQKPSIGDIVEALLDEPLDALGLNSLTKNIPVEFRDTLDSADFQALDMRVQKDASTGGKWSVVFFHVQVRLQGFQDVLDLLQPYVSFEVPVLDIVIHNPSDSANRAYQVSLSSDMNFANGLCFLDANFSSPPPGFVGNPESFSLGLQADISHPGLPIGKIVDKFIGVALDDLNITSSVPSQVDDVLGSITIDQAMISFVKVQDSWKLGWVEAMVTSQNTLSFENFKLNQVQLHFAHSSGAGSQQGPTNTVQFNTSLLLGSTMTVDAAFTYDTNSGWTISFQAGQTINLVDVILNGIQDIGLDISPVKDDIEAILTINILSFYIAYSNINDVETFTFSNDAGQGMAAVAIADIGISNISVTCSKPKDGTWSWTVALALPTPCKPFAKFCKLALLADLEIDNGKFALIKGTPPPSVIGQAIVPNTDKLEVTLCGTIKFTGSAFMDLIRNLISIDQVDICILGGQELTVAIPPGANPISLFDVFVIKSFFLDLKLLGFGLGASVDIKASWLKGPGGDPPNITFMLIVMDDGAFGGSISITEIDEPFGLPGLELIDCAFSLVWLAEAMEPQSLAAKAKVQLKEPGSEQISGRQVTSQNSHFRDRLLISSQLRCVHGRSGYK